MRAWFKYYDFEGVDSLQNTVNPELVQKSDYIEELRRERRDLLCVIALQRGQLQGEVVDASRDKFKRPLNHSLVNKAEGRRYLYLWE